MSRKPQKKIPFVEQTQKTECGLCCVCMINRYYNSKLTMKDIRNTLEVGRDGSSFQQLIMLLEKYNFNTKCYKIPTEKLENIEKPAIIFWGNNHFVVLEKVNKKTISIVDPAIGRISMDYNEFNEEFSEYAIVPKPTEEFEPKIGNISSWKYFLPYIFEKKLLYIQIFLLTLLSYVFTLGLPMIVQTIVDEVVGADTIETSFFIFGFLIAFSILYLLFTFIKNKYMTKLRAYLDKSLNTNIFYHLVHLPYKFFAVRSSGDLVFSLNSSMRIRDIFASQFITGLINCGAAFVILIYICKMSLILGIVACALFLINIIVVSITRPIILDNSRALATTQSSVQGVQVETVYSMLGVKMSAIEDDILSSWKKVYIKYYNKYLDNEKVSNYINSITSFLQFISPSTLLFVSIYLATKRTISIGGIISIYSLGGTFFGLSSSVLDMWTSFVNSSVIFDRLIDIVGSETEYNNEDAEKVNINGDIELKNVSFSYTKDSSIILKNISIKINRGTKVAIVGKSGSGKSTLAKLLVGLYQPTEGDIYFDNKNYCELNKKDIRQQIGMVPQDITLFNNSIYENIVMNRPDITIDDVVKACRIAHIDEEIEEMPMNYYTGISEMGLNLSGGQRQRIALARAIISRPKILLLDEATSSLDNINEKMVSDEFKKMGTSQIVIAHRLSTIIDSDLIIVMEHGKIVEKGSHDYLLQSKGYYSQLYSSIC